MMATNRTLLEQARELQALAQTGLMYCKDPFDRERYERIRAMAVDMLSTQVDAPAGQVSRLLSAGYPTPKLDTRAAIFDEEGRILMTHENSGEWSLPGGWVDENQSIRSNAVKEVKEETGLDVRGERLIAVQDCANHNALTYPYGCSSSSYCAAAPAVGSRPTSKRRKSATSRKTGCRGFRKQETPRNKSPCVLRPTAIPTG